MAITVKGRQFNAQGRTMREVDVTIMRPKHGRTLEYEGNFVLHLDIGSRTVSVSIAPEDWEKFLGFGHNPPPNPNATWQHKEPLKPHCRTHLEFRSDCYECERENL